MSTDRLLHDLQTAAATGLACYALLVSKQSLRWAHALMGGYYLLGVLVARWQGHASEWGERSLLLHTFLVAVLESALTAPNLDRAAGMAVATAAWYASTPLIGQHVGMVVCASTVLRAAWPRLDRLHWLELLLTEAVLVRAALTQRLDLPAVLLAAALPAMHYDAPVYLPLFRGNAGDEEAVRRDIVAQARASQALESWLEGHKRTLPLLGDVAHGAGDDVAEAAERVRAVDRVPPAACAAPADGRRAGPGVGARPAPGAAPGGGGDVPAARADVRGLPAGDGAGADDVARRVPGDAGAADAVRAGGDT